MGHSTITPDPKVTFNRVENEDKLNIVITNGNRIRFEVKAVPNFGLPYKVKTGARKIPDGVKHYTLPMSFKDGGEYVVKVWTSNGVSSDSLFSF